MKLPSQQDIDSLALHYQSYLKERDRFDKVFVGAGGRFLARAKKKLRELYRVGEVIDIAQQINEANPKLSVLKLLDMFAAHVPGQPLKTESLGAILILTLAGVALIVWAAGAGLYKIVGEWQTNVTQRAANKLRFGLIQELPTNLKAKALEGEAKEAAAVKAVPWYETLPRELLYAGGILIAGATVLPMIIKPAKK